MNLLYRVTYIAIDMFIWVVAKATGTDKLFEENDAS